MILSLLFGLFTIILGYWIFKVIYNIFFSPLSSIPGPLSYQLFPFLILFDHLGGKAPFKVLEYHLKYGPVVRLGWSQISFSTSKACDEIYKNYDYVKGDIYKIVDDHGESLFSTLNNDFHKKRKRIMAPSFGQKPIDELEPMIQTTGVASLISKIHDLQTTDSVIELNSLFHLMTFDVIGSLAFGRSFGMLENGHHPVVEMIKKNQIKVIVREVLPFGRLWFNTGSKPLMDFAKEAVSQAQQGVSKKTILDSLIEAKDPETDEKLSMDELAVEAFLQIAAGTDTSSDTLLWTVYLLLKNPSIYNKLMIELNQVFPKIDDINLKKCKSDAHYLSAVLYESMRILPVIAGIPERIVPAGGRKIENIFIPENVNVGVSIYSLHNHPSNWSNPDQFDPSRWINDQGKFYQPNKNFMPFLIGPRGCIGRNLAWMEIYLTIATLLKSFSIELKDKDITLNPVSFITMKPKESKLEVVVKSLN